MLIRRNKIHIKIVSILLLFMLMASVLGVFVNPTRADSYRYTYDGNNLNTNAYPGYKEKIDAIKAVHPNWNIVIMETGLDWNQLVVAESSITSTGSPYSLIQGKTGPWICSSCGTKKYDTGWYHASESAIKYYMDPRNWMDPYSSTILQFLQIGRVDASDDSIYNAIRGTFLDRDGLGWENAVAINRASRENNANPYYVVARIIQEQGVNGGSTYKMPADGIYYYNVFNIGASGNGTGVVVANALASAKSRGWDTLEKSISGGIKILFSDYINQKQDTIYLNKFDVETYGGLYHQYMQNIEAPKSEANLMYSKIKDSGILDKEMTVVIPVYLNMPSSPCASPDVAGEIGPKNIRVKVGHGDINIRSSRSTTSSVIGSIKNSDVIILSVERYSDGWHKIVLVDGKVGYIYFDTNYFEEINDITNCYDNVVVTNNVVLRAGPDATLPEITNLTFGQQLTRIDNTGRYNINGIIWDRVKLSDGRQGFIPRSSLQLTSEANNIFTIRADGGLYLRETPNGEIIRLLPDGTSVTRIEIATVEIDGYYWDKVTTPDGAVGYVARSYLRDINDNVAGGTIEHNLTEIKVEDSNNEVMAQPDVTVEVIKEKMGENAYITKPDGTVVDNGLIGTGYKIKFGEKEYTVVKMGDCNGSGIVDIIDMALIKRDLLDKNKLNNEYKMAAKISSGDDEEINIIDMALMKRYLLGKQDINLK